MVCWCCSADGEKDRSQKMDGCLTYRTVAADLRPACLSSESPRVMNGPDISRKLKSPMCCTTDRNGGRGRSAPWHWRLFQALILSPQRNPATAPSRSPAGAWRLATVGMVRGQGVIESTRRRVLAVRPGGGVPGESGPSNCLSERGRQL